MPGRDQHYLIRYIPKSIGKKNNILAGNPTSLICCSTRWEHLLSSDLTISPSFSISRNNKTAMYDHALDNMASAGSAVGCVLDVPSPAVRCAI
jgi:hypothetical protein